MHFSSRCVLHLQHALLVRNNAIKLDAKKCTRADPCCCSVVFIRACMDAHKVSAALDTW